MNTTHLFCSLLLSSVLGMTACQEVLPDESLQTGERSYQLQMQIPDVLPKSKSSIFAAEGIGEEDIRSTLVAIYLEGTLLRCCSADGGLLSLGVLNRTCRYSIYAVTGALTETFVFPEDEARLPAQMAAYREQLSEDQDFASFMSRYPEIPMCGKLCDCIPEEVDASDGLIDGRLTLPLERLFARIEFSIHADERIRQFFSERNIQKISLVQAAATAFPFCENGAADWEQIDCWEEGDVQMGEHLDFDETYVLYVPENLQGRLQFGNSLPSEKSYEKLATLCSEEKLRRLSYLETSIHFAMPGGDGGEVRYRFYLGQNNTDDFNILRGRNYRIRLELSYDNLYTGGYWKVDTEAYSDARELYFTTPPRDYAPGKDAYISCYYFDHQKSQISSLPNFAYRYRSAYAFGTESEIEAWLSDAHTLPAEYEIISAGYFQCVACETLYPGFPRGSSEGPQRLAFLKELSVAKLISSYTSHFCPSCGIFWYSENNYTPQYQFIVAGSSGSSYNIRIPSGYDNFAKIRIPDEAADGTVLRYYLATADGRIRDMAELHVHAVSDIPTELVLGKESLYLGEQTRLSARYVPTLDNTHLTRVNFSVEQDHAVVSLTGDAAISRNVQAIGVGSADLVCYAEETNEELARIRVQVQAPMLRFYSDQTLTQVAGQYIVPLDGRNVSFYAAPVQSNGEDLVFQDTDLALRIYSQQADWMLSTAGTGVRIASRFSSMEQGKIRISGALQLASFQGIDPRYQGGPYLPQQPQLSWRVPYDGGTLESNVPLSLLSAHYQAPRQPTRYIYHERLSEDYFDEEGKPLSLSDIRYDKVRSWQESESGLPIQGQIEQTGYSATKYDNAISWSSDATGTCLKINRGGSYTLSYQYPARYQLEAILRNNISGEEVRWPYAEVVLSERISAEVAWTQLQHNSVWQHAKYRLYIDEERFTRKGEMDLPFSFASVFDWSAHDPAEYEAFLKHYHVQQGNGKKEEVQESAISYTVSWDGWEKDILIPNRVGSAHLSDYVQWFRGDLCFHRKGMPSAKSFDYYTDSAGNPCAYSGIPHAEPVFWLHYDATIRF